MSSNLDGYKQRVTDIVSRAHMMRAALLDPILDDSGKFLADGNARGERLKGAVANTVYESAGEDAPMILGAHSRALQAFCQRYGRLPNDEILASAHKAIENALQIGKGKGLPGIFESADMSTTEGLMMRDRMVSLVLPVLLQSVTAQMTTLIPGQFNRSEMFRVYRVAGSSFGDLKAGDRIDYRYNGRYAVMDQMSPAYLGDASKTQFVFDTATDCGKQMPIKANTVRVLHDRNVVAADNGNGNILGVFSVGGVTVNVSGTVDYASGKVTAVFSAAPAAGIEVHIGYDVDIEKDYKLIPKIDHQMESRVLIPHESAITGSVTLQALWGLRREFGLDADNLAMAGMRNLLAADKDRKILRDMYFYARDVVEWDRTPNENLTLREHYESLSAALLELDSALMKRNGISGLVGLVGDNYAVNVFRYLPSPYFQAAPGYRSVPQPHYVGRVFGQFDLYCDPNQEAYTCLAFARGSEHGQTGYVSGDAVPALTFRHAVMGDLITSSTMWDLAYRDLQPFDGRDYLMKLKMVTTDTTDTTPTQTPATENGTGQGGTVQGGE